MFTGIQHWETRFIIIIQKYYRGHIIVTIINLWEEIKHNIEDEKEFQNKPFTVISAWTTGIILIKTVEKIHFEKKETPIVNQISTNNSKNNHNFQVMLNYLKLR